MTSRRRGWEWVEHDPEWVPAMLPVEEPKNDTLPPEPAPDLVVIRGGWR